MSPQPGIFALGTTDHDHLELDLVPGADPADLVARAAGLVDGLSTSGGVNLVVGFRPELWAAVADADAVLPGASGWTDDLVGPDGFTMPATQHDAWLWLSGGSRTAVFDATRAVVDALAPVAGVATETVGWLYRHDRDLTGFVDGTENPTPSEAPGVVAAPDGTPGAGGTVVLLQLWRHHTEAWAAEPVAVQERVIGRTKADSVELDEDDMPADSHVSRTVVEVDGEEREIYRRNVAYGDATDHGTVFVGFGPDQWLLAEMLRRMAGVGDGVRCALTRYTTPLTGAYYAVPDAGALAATGTRSAAGSAAAPADDARGPSAARPNSS